MQEHTIEAIDAYWTAYLGCPPHVLFDAPLVVFPHSAFKGYNGLFIVRRASHAVVTVPSELIDLMHSALRDKTARELFDRHFWHGFFGDALDSLVGPAYMGYADESTFRPAPLEAIRPLHESERPLLESLRADCSEEDWIRGNLDPKYPVLFGAFDDGALIGASGYQFAGEDLAQLGVIVHPDFDGNGLGTSLASAAAAHALNDDLIPQLRTLKSNTAAMTMARRLGFEEYAESLAVGVNVPRVAEYLAHMELDESDAEPDWDDEDA